jgi:hypothetical protein
MSVCSGSCERASGIRRIAGYAGRSNQPETSPQREELEILDEPQPMPFDNDGQLIGQ